MKKVEKWMNKCELAMMGKVVPVEHDEVVDMTKYILKVIKPEANLNPNFLKDTINKYSEFNEVTHMVTRTVWGMPIILYLLKYTGSDREEAYPDPFATDYGTGYPCAFTYAFNLADDWCSEFGDSFFEKHADGYYHVAN